jgi:hypothetical protein
MTIRKHVSVATLFLSLLLPLGCATELPPQPPPPKPQMVYHAWLMGGYYFSPAYFSDQNGHWLCDADAGKPIGKCDGSNYPYDLTAPPRVLEDGNAIGGQLTDY